MAKPPSSPSQRKKSHQSKRCAQNLVPPFPPPLGRSADGRRLSQPASSAHPGSSPFRTPGCLFGGRKMSRGDGEGSGRRASPKTRFARGLAGALKRSRRRRHVSLSYLSNARPGFKYISHSHCGRQRRRRQLRQQPLQLHPLGHLSTRQPRPGHDRHPEGRSVRVPLSCGHRPPRLPPIWSRDDRGGEAVGTWRPR